MRLLKQFWCTLRGHSEFVRRIVTRRYDIRIETTQHRCTRCDKLLEEWRHLL